MLKSTMFTAPPLRGRYFIRKMRGGSQAHLIRCGDGFCYIVKFVNNPQGGRRILVNEMLGFFLLRQLGIPTPETALVELDDDFLDANPEVGVSSKIGRIRPEAGVHFGSRYVAASDTTSVFDFLPSHCLAEVVNRLDFLGAMVFDRWASNIDGRQAVFYRARIAGGDPRGQTVGWVAQFIDHGLAFGGSEWILRDSEVQGIYCNLAVYGDSLSLSDFSPWLDRLTAIRGDTLGGALGLLPSEWIGGEEAPLARLVKALIERCERISGLLEASIRAIQKRQRSSARTICGGVPKP